jgi:DNA-binding NtrC family response regulator
MKNRPAHADKKEPRHRGSVLVVDDEAYVRESLQTALERRGFDAREASNAVDALTRLDGLDVVILDLKMPGAGGEDLLQRILERDPALPVVILTGHGSVSSAVECMRRGAFDYLLKPADPDELVLTIDRAIGQSNLRRELQYLRRPDSTAAGDGPLGESQAWQRVMELAHLVAPTDTSVLLLGESGTGKEELAKEIHRHSRRSDAAFVRVNCAAVPENLFESEFFGHRRGAFTGADADRDGRFRVAHGGTLLLDEIDSLPPMGQAKVLRVLQDGTFERVGDSKPTRVDVRLISATNHDLANAVEEGRFRADLFYRINVMPITLPPLRDRPGDVALLARAFLAELAPRIGKPVQSIDPEVIHTLATYSWPGNVRELRNVIERGILLAAGDCLTPESVPLESGPGAAGPLRAGQTGTAPLADLSLKSNLTAAERQLVVEALHRSAGVRRDAAEMLGIDPRNLAYYLKKHELTDGDS